MTLEEALQQHLGCTHTLKVVVSKEEELVSAVHHVAGEPMSDLVTALAGASAADGSAVFHALSNRLIRMPGHTRTPMHITDEEYAGFVA